MTDTASKKPSVESITTPKYKNALTQMAITLQIETLNPSTYHPLTANTTTAQQPGKTFLKTPSNKTTTSQYFFTQKQAQHSLL